MMCGLGPIFAGIYLAIGAVFALAYLRQELETAATITLLEIILSAYLLFLWPAVAPMLWHDIVVWRGK